MCTFEKCCFCIDLRTGCLIFAYLELIGQIILAGLTVPAIIAGQWLMRVDDKDAADAGLALTILFVVTLIFAVIFMAFIIGLLVGLHKNNPRPVKLYLIYSVVFTVLRLIMIILQVATTPTTLEDIAFPSFGMLVSIYILLVIRSYWLKMASLTVKKNNVLRWRNA